MTRFIPILIAASFLAGCGQPSEQRPQSAASSEFTPPMHKENEGILLCDETKNAIGLKTVAVSERKEGGEQILAVPQSAVLDTTAGKSVYVENGGHYKRTVVAPGRRFGEFTEITEGLYEGDNVVTSAVQALWLIELRAVKGGKGCCPMPKAKKGQTD